MILTDGAITDVALKVPSPFKLKVMGNLVVAGAMYKLPAFKVKPEPMVRLTVWAFPTVPVYPLQTTVSELQIASPLTLHVRVTFFPVTFSKITSSATVGTLWGLQFRAVNQLLSAAVPDQVIVDAKQGEDMNIVKIKNMNL